LRKPKAARKSEEMLSPCEAALELRVSGLMAEVRLSIGNQVTTSIITARSAREMNLKPGQAAAALIKATEVKSCGCEPDAFECRAPMSCIFSYHSG
jgi:molybdopterin-binding protein